MWVLTIFSSISAVSSPKEARRVWYGWGSRTITGCTIPTRLYILSKTADTHVTQLSCSEHIYVPTDAVIIIDPLIPPFLSSHPFLSPPIPLSLHPSPHLSSNSTISLLQFFPSLSPPIPSSRSSNSPSLSPVLSSYISLTLSSNPPPLLRPSSHLSSNFPSDSSNPLLSTPVPSVRVMSN